MKFLSLKKNIYPIVENGALGAKHLGEGKIIPVLVIDTFGNKDVEDLIMFHKEITAGNSKMAWCTVLLKRDILIFHMEFSTPMKIDFGIKFNSSKDLILIDGIINSGGFYLQTGKKGIPPSKKIYEPKLLIHPPNLNFHQKWDKKLTSILIKKYTQSGSSKKEALIKTKSQITEIRKLWKVRLGGANE